MLGTAKALELTLEGAAVDRGLDQERAGFLSVGTTAAATRVAVAIFEDLDRLGDTPYLADRSRG
jgi:hypothetical protein